MIEHDIARQLFACATEAGNSQHKRAHLIHLPEIVLALAADIARGRYQPRPFTVFAVTDPKLREIFAPAFPDRLVQQWLVRQIEPWFDKRFIDDSFANRRGVHAALHRLQHFMRQPGHGFYCQLDIRAFFPSIDRRILLGMWRAALPKMPFDAFTRERLDQVASAILSQSPINPPPRPSGNRALLAQIPPHKSLFHTPPGVGLPIGSLTSQFFANVYLDPLDQFIKHTLKVRGYLRYVDDFILLGECPETLLAQRQRIQDFLREQLRLELHPNKTVLQRASQGANFLGSIVYPYHRLIRQRSVRALRRRIHFFQHLVAAAGVAHGTVPQSGSWQRWLRDNATFTPKGEPTPALLQRMLSTLNSYYGVFVHAHTFSLRKHVYHRELGPLTRHFLPADKDYGHLVIRKHWLQE